MGVGVTEMQRADSGAERCVLPLAQGKVSQRLGVRIHILGLCLVKEIGLQASVAGVQSVWAQNRGQSKDCRTQGLLFRSLCPHHLEW